jgi:methoxymalonate biosynthesis acyl carrier protein
MVMNTASPVSVDDIKGRTKQFVFRFVRKRALEDSDDFFASGMVNSLFAMQLVLFVEKEFGVKVAGEDLDLNNFRTIDAISRFVEKKRALG